MKDKSADENLPVRMVLTNNASPDIDISLSDHISQGERGMAFIRITCWIKFSLYKLWNSNIKKENKLMTLLYSYVTMKYLENPEEHLFNKLID